MSVRDKDVSRGSFLRLFAAAPFAATAFAQGARAGDKRGDADDDRNVHLNFHFSGNSYVTGTTSQPDHQDRLVMGGSGHIKGKFRIGQTVYEGKVDAQGSFTHYDLTKTPASCNQADLCAGNIPLQFTGTWRATKLVRFKLLGLWGTDSEGNFPLAAGVLVLISTWCVLQQEPRAFQLRRKYLRC